MHFVSDLCGINMLGVSKSCLLYGEHAVCLLYVCMWVFMSCASYVVSACSGVAFVYNAVCCACVCSICVWFVCICTLWNVCTWYMCTMCIQCALCVLCLMSSVCVCTVAVESIILLGQSRHHPIPKSPEQKFECSASRT